MLFTRLSRSFVRRSSSVSASFLVSYLSLDLTASYFVFDSVRSVDTLESSAFSSLISLSKFSFSSSMRLHSLSTLEASSSSALAFLYFFSSSAVSRSSFSDFSFINSSSESISQVHSPRSLETPASIFFFSVSISVLRFPFAIFFAFILSDSFL